MGCGCNKEKPKGGGKSFTKAVVEIVNPEKITLLRKVVIPASLGDETTIPPAVGLYRNVVLCYEASKRVYLYSSDGIPTFISTDLDAIEDELERLGVAIEDEASAREQADEELSGSISDLSDALAEETSARVAEDDELEDAISTHTSQISDLSTGLSNEIDNRQSADTNLQSQIDAISAASDVKDIVGTHAELEAYDTTQLGNNDIIKVLQDETQDDATTYYRWSTSTQEFTLIGEEGPYYTKSQTDDLLTDKQNVLTAGNNITITGDTISATDTTYSAGNGLSLNGTTFSADTTVLQPKLTAGDNISITNNTISATDTTYTAGSGLDLTGTEFSIDNTVALKTDLPTVNNAIFTLQKNGSDVASFTANSAVDVTANITVPTDTAQLTNTAGYQTASDVASAISGKQDTLTPGNNIQINGNTISATNTTYSAGNGLDLTGTVFSADTDILQTKLTPGANITIQDGVISSSGGTYTAGNGLELSNNEFSIDDSIVALKSDIPVISSASLTIQRNGTDVATFTTDSPNPVTANILVPTNNAQLINGAGYQTASDVQSLISGKQDTLTPGNNIQISGNTISATDTKYSAGNGLNLTGTVFSADTETLATKSDLADKQDVLTAGTGIDITNDVISVTSSGPTVVQTTGTSTTDVMSQDATTKMIYPDIANYPYKIVIGEGSILGTNKGLAINGVLNSSVTSGSIAIGAPDASFAQIGQNGRADQSIAIGSSASAGRGMYSVAIGAQAYTNSGQNTGSNVALGYNSYAGTGSATSTVALGAYARTSRNGEVNIGTGSSGTGYNSTNYRVLGGVHDPVDDHDAATKGYVDTAMPTKTSDLTNDAGYLTNTNYATDTTGGVVKVGAGLQITNGVLSTTGGGVADAVEWVNVLNKPTDVSYWNNDAGYLTSVSWNDILSKPTFATVATSGSYNDLSDKPTIPTVPTDVSAFTNDANYQNSSQVQSAIATAVGDITSFDYQVVQTLPATGVKGTIYLVPNSGTSPNIYDEYIYVNNSFEKIGTTEIDLSDYVTEETLDNALADYTTTSELATVATSGSYNDLTNKPTIPAAQVNSNWNATSGVAQILNKPTKLSQFTNDSGFITSYTETDPIFSASPAAGITSSDIISWDNKSDFSGDYNDLTNKPTIPAAQVNSDWNATSGVAQILNKPTIPTATSDLTNDSGFITNTVNNLVNYTPTTSLAEVATSGSYNDLEDKPTIPAAQVNSDWNSNSGVSQILNKPTLATVATSGSYNDLTNKPTIPTVPTNVSAFTNDAGYQNSTQVQSAINSAISGITGFEYQVVQTLPATGEKGVIYLVSNSGSAPNIYDEYIWIESGQSGSFEKIGTTETDLSGYVTDGELQTALADYTTTEDLAAVATSGSYNDLSNKPTIPTVNNATLTIQKNGTTVKTFTANASSNVTANITVPTATSDLTNDSGFITGVAWGEVTGKPTFATVATTGSYDDLEDKPTIPAAQVNADWNATSGVAQILNKPTIPTVPTAGTTASAVSTTASGGNATTWSKSDHVHSISSSTITSALGYTPYDSTNPNGYTSNTGTITGVSANGTSVATSGVANIPSATTSRYGVTQLSSATNSTSTSLAATPSAVKAAYDLADSKQNQLTAGTGIDITNNVISATAVANTFASYQNGTLYITNSARNADTENF